MPVRTIPGTEVRYHLVNFDADGVERAESDGVMISEGVRRRLSDTTAPVTDVFFCSHGWKGDVPAAIHQYDLWVGEMAASADMAVAQTRRPGFNPLVIGVHWPSLPFGDEAAPESGVLGADEDEALEAQVAQFASSIADTKVARDAIRVILKAALRDNGERDSLPDHVRDAFEQLADEAELPAGGTNPGGAPGSEMGGWDLDAVYAAERGAAEADAAAAETAGGVLGIFDGLKGLGQKVLRQMSFWKMKERARLIGEGGSHELLVSLQKAAPATAHFHLMGHSFGCILISATVAGAPNGTPLVRPVDSLFLVQGALSLWCYSPDIPVAEGKKGYFNRILQNGMVRGPIVTTQSKFDRAVGILYPAAVRVKSQFVLGDEYPKYGAVGAYGIQGIGDVGENISLASSTHDYGFQNHRVYNLESSAVIMTSGGMVAGAHSDIAHPEVAHAFWQAALTAE